MVELAEAVLDHVIDRRPDLCGDVLARLLGQMTDDIVDVDFGERTHGVPSFQSFVMLESSSSHWEWRSEEHTSELQSRFDLVCRLLLEKKNNIHSYCINWL